MATVGPDKNSNLTHGAGLPFVALVLALLSGCDAGALSTSEQGAWLLLVVLGCVALTPSIDEKPEVAQ